jgi:glyoxylase-like metal-dependent hydrolase (beta-lactamase superfamily II)
MREILPGVFHWTKVHERIRIRVHSYYLAEPRVLIDPMLPRGALAWFEEHGPPREILLTNRHHYRHSGRFADAYGCVVRCHRAGLHEFTRGERVEPFDHGDELPGGIRALEVGALCPEETALLLQGGALAMGDAVIRGLGGKLEFVPDAYMGEDPEGVKRGLRQALRRLLEEDWDALLLAHGAPLVKRGKRALERFVEAQPG